MKTSEKLEYINGKIDILNKRLKNRTFKANFNKVGTNNYCLELGKESFKFNTYDDVMGALNFIDTMLNMAEKEILAEQEKQNKKK